MLLILSFDTESDKNKFEYIYARYKNLMLYKAYGILNDNKLAEDAVSEAFIRIYKNLHKIEDATTNKSIAFIITIVKNTALTILSKEKKNISEEYDDNLQDDFNLEGHIMSELSSEYIYTLLNTVNEDLRSVFLLKFAYDLSHKEIGKILNITENNVTVKLHRAKKKIAEMLVKEGYASERN